MLAITDHVLATASFVLFMYALLQHRVVDIGFAINRALVFGAFTGFLLVSFGIAEWLIDHVVTFEQREKSVLIDGSIAIGIFLLFHRVRDWIEQAIERIFFRSWHAKEAELNHFLATAPHFSDPNTLAAAFLTAVDAYAGSRGSGLYSLAEAGHFVLERSTLSSLPSELGADHALVVEMKTFASAVQLASPLALASAAIALPMVRRSDLVGFLVIGQKIARDIYRPDEVENLARAARQVGFDLYALRLDQIERRRRALEEQLVALRQAFQSTRGVIQSTSEEAPVRAPVASSPTMR
jgi:hypothetical protein